MLITIAGVLILAAGLAIGFLASLALIDPLAGSYQQTSHPQVH